MSRSLLRYSGQQAPNYFARNSSILEDGFDSDIEGFET